MQEENRSRAHSTHMPAHVCLCMCACVCVCVCCARVVMVVVAGKRGAHLTYGSRVDIHAYWSVLQASGLS